MNLKIGELAKRVGLSVRALHHYDRIGLLTPSVRTPAGARLYGKLDLVRLHRIQALKQLGCSLADVRVSLDDSGTRPLAIIERQIVALEAQARRARTLSQELRHLAAHLGAGGETAENDWLDVLEMMAIHQQHFDEDELRALRNPETGAAHEIDAQWVQLVAEVTEAMQSALPVDSLRAHALAWRWVRLVIARTGNDAALATKLKAMQESEPRAQEITGIAPATIDWIGHALAHARVALFAKHLTAAQTAEVRRRQLAGMPHMDDWPALVAQVRKQMKAGHAPDTAPVLALAMRWLQLFRDSYCGDDRALESSVREAFAKEPDLSLGVGVDAALMRFMHQAALHAQRSTQRPSSTGDHRAKTRKPARSSRITSSPA